MRNLVIDIGNSRVKMGVFADGQLIHLEIRAELDAAEILLLTTNHAVQNVILSTVRTVTTAALAATLRERVYYQELTAQTPLPITNAYGSPATLGKDRLAAVVGAQALYPAEDLLVVDAGTCMTLDWLTADGVYHGGNIAPGVNMRWQAMHTFTARLPWATHSGYAADLGNTTATALENGGLLGAALEIEGLQARLATTYSDLRTILTGGDAALLVKRMKSKIFVHDNLVLLGLNKILEYNVKRLV